MFVLWVCRILHSPQRLMFQVFAISIKLDTKQSLKFIDNSLTIMQQFTWKTVYKLQEFTEKLFGKQFAEIPGRSGNKWILRMTIPVIIWVNRPGRHASPEIRKSIQAVNIEGIESTLSTLSFLRRARCLYNTMETWKMQIQKSQSCSFNCLLLFLFLHIPLKKYFSTNIVEIYNQRTKRLSRSSFLWTQQNLANTWTRQKY